MARFSLLLFVVVLTAGCGSSQRITASDPSEREKLNTSIQNEEVVLHLEDDTEVRAQNVCIEPDSVSFIEPEKKLAESLQRGVCGPLSLILAFDPKLALRWGQEHFLAASAFYPRSTSENTLGLLAPD